jgi:uncharacterized protein with GYD domain
MPTYITLIRFTDQGARAIRETAQRAAAFRKEAEGAGVTVRQVFWTMGAFDGLLILEAADEQAAAKVLFDLAAKGNVHTQTLRAFDESEIRQIVGGGSSSRTSGKKR